MASLSRPADLATVLKKIKRTSANRKKAILKPLDGCNNLQHLAAATVDILSKRTMTWAHSAVGDHPRLGRVSDSLLGRWKLSMWRCRGLKVMNKIASCSSRFIKVQPAAAVRINRLHTERSRNGLEKNKTKQQNSPTPTETQKCFFASSKSSAH